MNSCSCKYLVIDLTARKTEVRELSERLFRDYLGGAGLGARLLLEWSKPGADALSPDNPIVFACGALAGTMAPASACHAVVTKSPLTGLLSSSVSSGLWSLALKRTGFDAVVITGAASSPVHLFIDDSQVHFRKADSLMGKGCLQTEAAIRQRIGDSRVQVAPIGPAGESLVRFATIRDGHRLPHRGGVGAVMGAKKLKAIAVRGTRPVSVPDIRAMQKACADLNAHLHQSAVSSSRGPSTLLNAGNPKCMLPTRNFQQSIAQGAGSLAAECAKKEYLIKAIACPTCPVACQHVYRLTEDPHSDEQVVLENEALAALGPMCGMYHLPVILKAIELCQFYGLDPVSAGVSVAWAMECFERGLLSSKDTQGLDLSFGSADGVVETIRRIGQRRDVGSLLDEGVKRASAKLGHGSEDWAMHVKGLEIAGCDPRGTKSPALSLAAGLRSPELDDSDSDSPPSLKDKEDLAAAGDSIGICRQASHYFRDFLAEAAQLYTLATGIPMSAAEIQQAGERINALTKAFNVREGWRRADDRLPSRLLKDPLDSGKAAGAVVSEKDLKTAIDEYYRARGWTAEGTVPLEKLKALGLDDVQGMLKGN